MKLWSYHWQCYWRVAWTSSRMCAGNRRTFRATIVTIFNDMIETFQFLSNVTRFLDCYFKLPQIWTAFRKVVRQHTESMVVIIIRVLLQTYFSFQQWKKLKIRWKLAKLLRWVWCTTFWDTVKCECMALKRTDLACNSEKSRLFFEITVGVRSDVYLPLHVHAAMVAMALLMMFWAARSQVSMLQLANVTFRFSLRDVMRCLSVRPSVCIRLSRSLILSKRVIVGLSSIFFHHRVATPF